MKKSFEDILNILIDDRCEIYGVNNTIAWLLDAGLTETDLLDLHFDKDDIDYVISQQKEEFETRMLKKLAN